MNGKDKCAILKQIRRDIAKKNDIALTIAECKHKGDCAGTCPRCEAEVKALERALAERRREGKKVFVAGISAALIAASCTSCEPIDSLIKNNMTGIMPANNTDLSETIVPDGDGNVPDAL